MLVNFREYILKIALTRSKTHKIAFGSRVLPGPAGELTALPRPPSWINGSKPTSKGRGWAGSGGRGEKSREGEGGGGKKKWREGKDKGG